MSNTQNDEFNEQMNEFAEEMGLLDEKVPTKAVETQSKQVTNNTTPKAESTVVNGLPEAPASVTYNAISPKGFPLLFTVRENSGLALLDKMVSIEKRLTELNYTPQPLRSFGKPKEEIKYVEGKKCPTCQGRLIEKKKQDGKPFHVCEFRTYDFKTKQSGGCKFIDWLEPQPTSDGF